MPNIGPLEIVVILAVVLLIFGPKRLPGAGKALGQSMREFKDSISGSGKHEELAPPTEGSAVQQPDAAVKEPAAQQPAPPAGSPQAADANGESGSDSPGSGA